MTKRPILVAVIGYIIGILVGLYFKISIVLIYCLITVLYLIVKNFYNRKKRRFNLISFYRYFRYIKLILNSKVIVIIFISSIISNSIILIQNQKYKYLYSNLQDLNLVGYIASNREENTYKDIYCIRVETLNNSKKYKNTKLLLKVNKINGEVFEYGDKVTLKGEFLEANSQRNYGGFDYKEYLKTKNIYGSVNVKRITKIQKANKNNLLVLSNNISLKLKGIIENMLNEEEASILKGLILGDTSNIEESVYEKFQISNMVHILAVSGMHISYIIIGTNLLFKKVIGNRKTKYAIIIILIIYMFISGFSPSIVRSTIMGVLVTLSGILYRKNDIWTSISLSLIIILIYNPFLINNIGLQLSYLGTIGIILLHKNASNILKSIKTKNIKYKFNKKRILLIGKVKDILAITFSVQIMILPIILYRFNFIGIYFVITSLITSIIIGPIIFLGIISIISFIIFKPIGKMFCFILQISIIFLIKVSNFSNLPFAKIYIPTPKIWMIIAYFILIYLFNFVYLIYHKKNISITERRFRNLIELFKFKIRNSRINYKMLLITTIILVILYQFIPKDLKIYFVDVGQGDSTFIITPHNKTILIDGGGSVSNEFDVGKKTLVPYILDRGYTKIDYVIISHFDQDHVGGILYLIKEIKVKNIIIGKQFENSENLQEFLKIVKEKNIKVNVVKVGDKINIEKDLYFDVLWPDSSHVISENSINNNALVCKLNYKHYTMLFTGDIEKEAEEVLVSKYNNTDILKSTVLKVAHHGSKSSSMEEFLKLVQPKVALIGVGKNNTFGHPNDNVINRLSKLRCKSL